MPSITPCLWFDDQGEQAAEFYTSLFPNSRITSVARYGPGGMRPEGSAMTVQFELDGREYVALNGGPIFPPTEAFSLQVFCVSQDEIDHYWNSLTADGGCESQCGWLKDRWGVSWQIVPTALGELLGDPDPERSRRATEAMLKMSKIDIEEIRRAAAGE
ncbi:VOC family protein [Frankia sp. AgKG'84/4]|uniref:VOC family protein n=1 Tax=Frankia sp. AgKG'84/4 TaxID=573490 RepID=UPI00200EBEF5|nr:VOC family protein [Frankia sp. AgKG'84/4]MCL9793457.1 VOC family protein [Frankia sp. AgKG'84/4]